MTGFLYVMGLLGVMVLMCIWGYFSAKKRAKALEALARELGLRFDRGGARVHEQFAGFSPFDVGDSRESDDLLHGHYRDLEWRIFDYHYSMGSHKNRTHHQIGVIAVGLPVTLPKVTIQPEGFFHKIAAMAGFDDINFESEQFSRAYHVKCDDRKLAYDLFHPQAIELLLSIEKVNWQIAGFKLVMVHNGFYSAPQIRKHVNEITAFVAMIPDYLKQERSGSTQNK